MENNDKLDLVIFALQQRIGELVSSYETQIAVLRAEITMIVDEKEKANTTNQEVI